MVDEEAGELVTDCLVDQRCCHGGVNTAGERADHLSVANLLADRLDLFVNDGACSP